MTTLFTHILLQLIHSLLTSISHLYSHITREAQEESTTLLVSNRELKGALWFLCSSESLFLRMSHDSSLSGCRICHFSLLLISSWSLVVRVRGMKSKILHPATLFRMLRIPTSDRIDRVLTYPPAWAATGADATPVNWGAGKNWTGGWAGGAGGRMGCCNHHPSD